MSDFDVGSRFDSPAALNRLNNAYFLYAGQPVFLKIHGGNSYKGTIYTPGAARELGVIDLQEDEKFSLSSLELGFMNSANGDAVYIYRRPMRQWHYLYENNCAGYSLLNRKDIVCQSPQFYCKEFADMVLGKYPEYRAILAVCKEKPFFHAKAFDRYFAIRSQVEECQLFYRDEVIAKYSHKDDIWELDPKFDYPTLISHLENHGINFGV